VRPFAPSPVLHLLRDAAALVGGPSAALVDTVAAGYPRSLQRRPAQLLRSAHAAPADLDQLLSAAGFADLDDVRRQASRENGTRLAARELRYTERGDGVLSGDRAGLERTLRREQDNLAETLRSLQGSGALELAARSILRSRRRWVFGDLKSRGYAHLFASDLTVALNQVTLVDPTAGSATAALGDAHHLDSLTLFCFRRYSRLTVRVAEQFAARGATVIAITDSDSSPAAPYADHVLRVVTRSDTTAHSPTAVTAIGHALAALAAAGAKGAARRARQSQDLALAMDWYVS
jgi:DNA-binding MurR/RpiR family transcriptional regulator